MSDLKRFERLKIQLGDLLLATNNFSENHCIGKGGFGKVYKGELVLSEGHTTVAVKCLDRAFGQGDREFWNEILMLSLYKHENIVPLLGFCDDAGEKILVYAYASKRGLDLYLNSLDLSWDRRLKICIGAARGLVYLHDPGVTQQRLLHRDIKSSNILLNENWNVLIADFGLSKFCPANLQYSLLFSNPVGTFGYTDPLYIETGLLTKESDVYSFGVVLFEVLCGRLCNSNNDKPQSFTEMVRNHYKQNNLDAITFSNIKDEINANSLKAFATIAYQCLKRARDKRPSMKEILATLETALEYQDSSVPKRMSTTNKSDHLEIQLTAIILATSNFAAANCIGKGRFGTVYKGESSNILLDENWNAKITDFGLSEFGPTNQQYPFLVKDVVGTHGYCDPLYLRSGYLTKQSDVYTFGVVLFEVLCGRLCIANNDTHSPFTELVRNCYELKNLNEVIYSGIKDQINPRSLKVFAQIAYQCLNDEGRPPMKEIVRALETALKYQES